MSRLLVYGNNHCPRVGSAVLSGQECEATSHSCQRYYFTFPAIVDTDVRGIFRLSISFTLHCHFRVLTLTTLYNPPHLRESNFLFVWSKAGLDHLMDSLFRPEGLRIER